jgi:hypothetical protein
MLNGRFDFFYPTEPSQEPMFRLLGTPAEQFRTTVIEQATLTMSPRLRSVGAGVTKSV